MIQKELKTREEVRRDFLRRGVSVAKWAREHGVNRTLVHAVLNEERPCRFGESHKIAVLLGIKDGEIVEDGCNTLTEKGVAVTVASNQDATP